MLGAFLEYHSLVSFEISLVCVFLSCLVKQKVTVGILIIRTVLIPVRKRQNRLNFKIYFLLLLLFPKKNVRIPPDIYFLPSLIQKEKAKHAKWYQLMNSCS